MFSCHCERNLPKTFGSGVRQSPAAAYTYGFNYGRRSLRQEAPRDDTLYVYIGKNEHWVFASGARNLHNRIIVS